MKKDNECQICRSNEGKKYEDGLYHKGKFVTRVCGKCIVKHKKSLSSTQVKYMQNAEGKIPDKERALLKTLSNALSLKLDKMKEMIDVINKRSKEQKRVISKY